MSKPKKNKQLGFVFSVTLSPHRSEDADDQLPLAFLEGLVEPSGLYFVGCASGGIIICRGSGSASESDREIVRDWFFARPEVLAIAVGPLVDVQSLDIGCLPQLLDAIKFENLHQAVEL